MKEIKLSEPFAIKFISTIFKPMRKGVISVIYNKLTDSRYRHYSKLNEWIKKQYDLCNGASIFNDFHYDLEMLVLAVRYKNGEYDNDKLIVDILKYVNKNIRYQTDSNNFGYVERWEDLTETVKRKKGDCENMNALIYVMARMAGIPSYLLWNCTGLTTSGEGHYWLMYFSPRKAKFYSIDAAYKPNKSYLQYRQPFKLGKDYKRIHFIFNENFVMKSK